MNKKLFGLIFVFAFLAIFNTTHIASAATTVITSIEPSPALVGDTVIINGSNFTDANGVSLVTKIYFGSIDVGGFFTVDSPTKITAIVPKGATTNTVTLTTKNGEVTSPSKFIVKPNPVINISIKNVDSTSVTFKASGLENGKTYNFSLYDITDSELNRKLADKQSVVVDLQNPSDDVLVTFSNLLSSTSYMGEIKTLSASYSVKFKTPFSTKNLNDLISQALKTLYDAKEGTEVGQYKSGSKAIFSKAISDAEYINGNISIYTQSDVGNAVRDLDAAMNTFELAKVVGSTATTATSTRDTLTGGIVPKCNTGEIDKVTGQYKTPCNFSFFMDLINRIIKFALFVIATPLVALIIMYTGYLYLTAGGSAGQTEKAKHILLSVVVGYMIALGAWIIVNTIMSAFKVDPSINTFLEK